MKSRLLYLPLSLKLALSLLVDAAHLLLLSEDLLLQLLFLCLELSALLFLKLGTLLSGLALSLQSLLLVSLLLKFDLHLQLLFFSTELLSLSFLLLFFTALALLATLELGKLLLLKADSAALLLLPGPLLLLLP